MAILGFRMGHVISVFPPRFEGLFHEKDPNNLRSMHIGRVAMVSYIKDKGH